jgi:WD40 repeat protein
MHGSTLTRMLEWKIEINCISFYYTQFTPKMSHIISTKTLYGHTSAVQSVCTINNIIISGSYDQTIKIWDINTYECIKTLDGHTDAVYSVFAINDIIISGSYDKTIKIHEYITYKQMFTALMCMWKLDYPNEIIHEVFKWLNINTYASVEN